MSQEKCLFCDLQTSDRERIIAENDLAYAVRDGFPVTRYHTLFIPKRHTFDFFGLTSEELVAIQDLIQEQKKLIEGLDASVEGFNVGMNCGEIAGQSIWHCHIHLIPRRKGDVKNPKGGVRNIISGKGDYSGNPLRVEDL
jgi:diadenosine tetraphosphate (Ap4A) HIT family hydrolase